MMRSLKTIWLVLLFLLYYLNGFSQENIYFNFDFSVFKGEDQKSILEIYYSVNQKSLKYIKSGNDFEAAAKIDILVTDMTNNTVVIDKSYKSPSVAADTSDEKLKQKIVGQINYLLIDSRYKLKIIGSDFNESSKSDIFEEDFTIDNNSNTNVRCSNIELSTFIQKSQNEASNFYKNTLEVIPNPSNLFGMNLKELYYYFEIYGLSESNISDEFTVNYLISNLNNEIVVSFDKKVKRTSESKAEFGKINIDSLERGSYFFKVNIKDSIRKLDVMSEKKFYIFNNKGNISPLNPQDEYLKSEYAIMEEDALEKEFKYAMYIMMERDISNFNELNSIADKRKFMYDFWKSKDNIPGTLQNEFKINYFKRVLEANKNFKEAYNEGWKTDRGRIFLIYGKPDDIERFPFESNKKSYVIWKYYQVEGGGECVFIEKQSTTGVFWLVHSTFRAELKNPEWEKELQQ